jgi:hypothetical protein
LIQCLYIIPILALSFDDVEKTTKGEP